MTFTLTIAFDGKELASFLGFNCLEAVLVVGTHSLTVLEVATKEENTRIFLIFCKHKKNRFSPGLFVDAVDRNLPKIDLTFEN